MMVAMPAGVDWRKATSTGGMAPRVAPSARRSPSARTPIMAWTVNPTDSGSVTATTCMTPESVRRWTRWRTAACESPTSGPSLA